MDAANGPGTWKITGGKQTILDNIGLRGERGDG